MAKSIIIDGVRYIPQAETGPIKIVVIERGFVYVGRVENNDEGYTIHAACALIRWGTTKHLGELINGPLSQTKLGAPCTVQVRFHHVIHIIEVSQDGWARHIHDC